MSDNINEVDSLISQHAVDLGSLAITPSLDLEDVLLRLHDYSASLCTAFLDNGLADLHVARTPARFAALGLTEDDGNGNEVPMPYPVLPTKPVRPPNNASAVALELYREESKLYFAVRQGITALRSKLLAAVGEVILDELRGQPGGLAALSLADILEFLDDHYGEPSEDDLRILTRSLAVKFTSVQSFRADAPKMKLSFTKLARFGHQLSELQQMQYLEDATNLLPPIVEAIKDYKKQFVSLRTRSFDSMVAYIKTHVPLSPAGAAGYVGSANGSTAPLSAGDVADALFPRLVEHFAGLAAATGRGDRSGRGGQRGRGGRGGRGEHNSGRGSGATSAVLPPSYCFAHGYGQHAGTVCRKMASDPSYTEAMKRATAPCTLDGYEGHK